MNPAAPLSCGREPQATERIGHLLIACRDRNHISGRDRDMGVAASLFSEAGQGLTLGPIRSVQRAASAHGSQLGLGGRETGHVNPAFTAPCVGMSTDPRAVARGAARLGRFPSVRSGPLSALITGSVSPTREVVGQIAEETCVLLTENVPLIGPRTGIDNLRRPSAANGDAWRLISAPQAAILASPTLSMWRISVNTDFP